MQKPRFKLTVALRLLRKHSYLTEVGWFEAYKAHLPVDAAGQPIPMIAYPCFELLKRRVRSEMAVFEYGSGNSTLWWAARCKKVVTVEHDASWYGRLADRIPPNVTALHVPVDASGAYCRKVLDYRGAFDIVMIDGMDRERVACAKNGLEALTPAGVMVWDDSERERYREGFEFLHARGFRRIPFVGMSPNTITVKETSVFYRPGNVLDL
ncbi:MAG: class I SAM-dependent methyltransferase [Candidatus Lambdaproteobacteria bacterium]|nr:class I SAM-dependent methyltransferase [Candidatus Lambdaproteobacteria bacterium]